MHNIAVIIPCYNEAKRLDFNQVLELISSPNINVYFANDGSTDNTVEVIEKFRDRHKDSVYLIDFPQNVGKANTIYKAVFQLMENSRYTHIAYLDADFSTSSAEFLRLCNEISSAKDEFIFASRIQLLNANINRKIYRHFIGRLIVTLINIKFALGIYDTQCGAKIFSKNILNHAFTHPFKTSWLFDVEVFVRLKSKDLLKYGKEIPISNWKDVEGSKLKPAHALSVLKEVITLFKNY